MISATEAIEKIETIVAPILEERLLELVEVEFRPSGKRWLLRIYIDKEGGVTIDDCEYVSRELSRVLDVEDPIEHPYTLEVSSPGLTRALKKLSDFVRYKGRKCRIITGQEVEGRHEFVGKIVDTTGEDVLVQEKIDMFTIPICAIKKAHLEFDIEE
ncbi:MAG: ribosome maturation factor RimP [Syntrophorhabdaceae bacterium]|nr:ribosome maturation factor RimP [Syntrophorhabdaceae bacterium]MDD4196358.1 ribosome maturation factor RimP [Syntrophorhabdaceae bacterium]HOC44972.1 ribosome maturation factor RimP [Syntrophorhabdaceae bacterium]